MTPFSKILTVYSKYNAVGTFLQEASGTLLDVGARDCRLSEKLNSEKISYYSADVEKGYDYQINLEEPLQIADHHFDYVVALDVLEHVEHIHLAFQELARISRKVLIIGLPNMATIYRRWRFLWSGHLGTKKYDLLPEHQGDRHRWLTTYHQMYTFVQQNAIQADFHLNQVIEEMEGKRLTRGLGYIAAKARFLPSRLLVGRCIYILERNNLKI